MRFFTPLELEQRLFPSPQDFQIALDAIAEGLSRAYETQEPKPTGLDMRKYPVWFAGAVVFGSVARGSDLRRTSDIDILACFDDASVTTHVFLNYIRKLRQCWTTQLLKEKVARNIPINVYPVTASRLKLRKTRLNTQFLGHSVRALDGLPESLGKRALLCGDEAGTRRIFNEAPRLTKDGAEYYITKKYEALFTSYGSWEGLKDDEKVRALANVVNGVFHGARQVLDVLGAPYRDTKIGVIDACGDNGLGDIADDLVGVYAIAKGYEEDLAAFVEDGKLPPVVFEDRLLRTGIQSLERLLEKL